MPNYFNSSLNIITFFEYYNNLKSYQFAEIIEINDKDYLNAIKADYRKELYKYLSDSEIDIKSIDDLILKKFNNPFDYIIIDSDSIEKFYELHSIYTWQILDFAYYIDMPEELKFNFIYTAIRAVNVNIIIKIKKDLRNLITYPVDDNEINELISIDGFYEYDDLFL